MTSDVLLQFTLVVTSSVSQPASWWLVLMTTSASTCLAVVDPHDVIRIIVLLVVVDPHDVIRIIVCRVVVDPHDVSLICYLISFVTPTWSLLFPYPSLDHC